MKKIAIIETVNLVGKKVELYGWVNSIRDHSNVVFIDLRDRSGQLQIVGGKELKGFSSEDVVKVEGVIKERGEKYANKKIPTGKIELEVGKIELISKSKPLPFEIIGDGYEIDENIRLKHRYLDLRRQRLRHNLEVRSKMLQLFRQKLSENGFWEIETPYISKATPEGARDFLVPSRMQPGYFYALPQSPQQYKQLLMVAGIEKYFQIARCFRDEDLRADRQFEFFQVDIEMSFVTMEDVLETIEPIVIEVFEAIGMKIQQKPFPRISYHEAIKKYGADKFDLRKDKKDSKLAAFTWVVDFPLFEKTETREITPVHHPFTSPNPQDLPLLDKNPLKVRAWQYDLVCNGYEAAGGSIRITDPKLQQKIFKILGHKKQEIKEKFGHLLEAFEYGVPPHGGIAMGFDRLVMIACGENNIREVMAFPMTSGGQTAVMDAPARVSVKQLRELGIKTIDEKEEK
jgi:aspartyl-tRNA synthetase